VTTFAEMLQGLIAKFSQGAPDLPAPSVPEEPDDWNLGREIRWDVAAPDLTKHETITVEEARERIRAGVQAYLDEPNPDHMLLIRALPGVGKTTAAVWAAEVLADEGRRVLYAGPRHDFYGDIMGITEHPELWYEWQPRQAGDPEAGKPETCPYADAVNDWLHRGYKGIDFCQRVCGWDFVRNGCKYHGQKAHTEPCIFGQHQHVVLGHPLTFDVVIGDEQPMSAFLYPWEIPSRWILPSGIDLSEPLAEVLHKLELLAENGVTAQGTDLLTLLGGAQTVLNAAVNFVMPSIALMVVPSIHEAKDVEDVPYSHLPLLIPLLIREAQGALKGHPCPARLLVKDKALTLLLRRPVNDRLPRHIVWLDATGNETLYQACFQRDVQVLDAQPKMKGHIFQVHDRANGKTSLESKGELTAKAQQMELQVQRIIETGGYQNPAIITYQNVIAKTETYRNILNMHYFAARGTNALEGVDALVVAGVPQPPVSQVELMARMIFFERDEPFNIQWFAKDVSYEWVGESGTGAAYPTSGFWGEPQLQAVLWSMREAEVIQAAHRCRPVNHEVDIWLLLNLPVRELPPERLLSLRELFGAPEGVSIWNWPDVLEYAELLYDEREVVTSVDLCKKFGLTRKTAVKYLDKLVKEYHWVRAVAVTKGKTAGQPPKAVMKGKER
jgi:hypothetical protein